MIDYGELARALIREGLPHAIAAQMAPPNAHPEWADKLCNPYGSERAFLDAARRGEFKTFRRSRRITAMWVDVANVIKHTRGAGAKPRPSASSEPDVDIGKLVEESRPRRSRVSTHG